MSNLFKYAFCVIVLVLLFPFFLITFYITKIYVFPSWESGNLADWSSFLCNLTMAGAAIFAAIKSKSWFKDKKIENAAIKLENLLLELNPLMARLDAFYDHLNYPKSGNEMVQQYNEDKKAIIINYHKYKSSHNLLKLWGSSIFRNELLHSAKNVEINSFEVYEILNKSGSDNYASLPDKKNKIQKTIEEIRIGYKELNEFNIDTLLNPKK